MDNLPERQKLLRHQEEIGNINTTIKAIELVIKKKKKTKTPNK